MNGSAQALVPVRKRRQCQIGGAARAPEALRMGAARARGRCGGSGPAADVRARRADARGDAPGW